MCSQLPVSAHQHIAISFFMPEGKQAESQRCPAAVPQAGHGRAARQATPAAPPVSPVSLKPGQPAAPPLAPAVPCWRPGLCQQKPKWAVEERCAQRRGRLREFILVTSSWQGVFRPPALAGASPARPLASRVVEQGGSLWVGGSLRGRAPQPSLAAGRGLGHTHPTWVWGPSAELCARFPLPLY